MPPDDADPDGPIRPELAELRARTAATLDAARPDAVAKRRATGHRTARENIADLVDAGSFLEYGGLALAAQRGRHSVDELVKLSPADGLVAGIGTINAATAGDRARAMILAYDYTVFAGTQGGMSHKKLDRMLGLAAERRLPVVLFAEGGGGRPNDTDMPLVAGLDTTSFRAFAALAGLAPRVGIVAGRCFAGNAALLGLCDVVIATESSSIGMGGPAMIEGGGLGVVSPEEVGPIDLQVKSGVVDVRVRDEAEAVAVAKRYLGYFQGDAPAWAAADQVTLRTLVPAERRRAFKVRPILETLADAGSVLELRRDFGTAMVTALARIEGRAVGVIANSSQTLGGAIDADAADKAARFLQLCDAFDLPVVSLCDTPGFMVGPKAEATGLVRHASRLFAVAASLRVPVFSVVLRRGYGLGAQAMTAGHFHASAFTVAWPTGEFGAMGIEGAARLSLKKQLAAIADPAARDQLVAAAVATATERGKAISMASYLEIDGVIDPADTRAWLARGLRTLATEPAPRPRRWLDTW
jgi:acetyl-CoA carboxylase carboxyltransferase component